jgi:integrase
VPAINVATNEKYLRERQAAGVSWQTINRERAVLRAALNHARKHHGLVALPHVPIIGPSDAAATPVEPKGRPLSVAELASPYGAAKSDHMRLFILILLGTCCRPDAARDLKIASQLDFEHRRINLNPPGRRQTKKVRPIVPMAKFLSL